MIADSTQIYDIRRFAFKNIYLDIRNVGQSRSLLLFRELVHFHSMMMILITINLIYAAKYWKYGE